MGTSGADKDMLDRVLGELAGLREENRRLAARVDALTDSLEARSSRVATSVGPSGRGDGAGSDGSAGLSRRRLLKRAAGAGALGAGVLAVGDIFGPRAARAAAGDAMILGAVNNADTAGTSLTAAPGTVATLNVLNSSVSGSGLYGQATAGSGLDSGPAGVIGDSNLGSGVVGLTTFVNSDGVLGVQNNFSGIIVPITANSAAGIPPAGVCAETNKAPYAVVGTNSVGAGVYGCAFDIADFSPPVAGVVGDTNSSVHPALMGRNKSGAQLRLVPSGVVHPASGAAGDLFEDKNNILWLCVGGTSWRKLGGLKTAGQLHVLPSPVRVYDSRTKDGPLANGQERTVSLTTGTNGTTPAVPAGAIASLFTLTIVNTGSSGFLAAFSNAVSYPGTSNIDWFLINSILATSVTSAVDASAKIKVHCGGTKTDFVIDVTGYYE